VLPNRYNAGFWHVLWVTGDFTEGDFGNVLGTEARKCSKVPL
jgi:hypothetical protein